MQMEEPEQMEEMGAVGQELYNMVEVELLHICSNNSLAP